MKKRITVDYHLQAINFNDELESLVKSLTEAEIRDEIPRKLESLYARLYVESAECEQHANRALEILSERFPDHRFAAHSDANPFRSKSWWRILATSKTGRPLTKLKLKKVRAAAIRIVRNIAAKYPEAAEKHRQEIARKEDRTGFWGAIKNLLDL